MPSQNAYRFQFEPMRVELAADISGTYSTIGTPLAFPCRQFYIVNNTDALCTFSIDGVNDHFVVASDGFILDDVSSNQAQGIGMFVAANTQFWVKGSPTTGSVFLTIAYGAD